MAHENEILKQGIKALEEIGLHTISYESLKNSGCDYRLKLRAKNSEEIYDYFIEVKSSINNANLSQWIMNLRSRSDAPRNLVLLTRYVPPNLAERLRSLEISFFDAVGNAYFDDSPLYIYVTGKKASAPTPKTLSPFRPAGIKLLLQLINQPGLEERDYREIAETTGVPKSTVGELMNDLERLQFLKLYKSKRRLINKSELLKRWVEAFTESYRPKLVRAKFRAPEGKSEWWESAPIIQYQACWGGEVAAQKLVGHIKPKEVTIYADSLLPRIQAQYGLQRDPNGDVIILRKFWTDGLDHIAPPLIVYADLISTLDSRNLETAQMIYEKYLDRLVEDSPK